MSILQGTADVFRLMSRLQRGITMSDIVNHLKIPKSTASRLLKQMREYGFVDRDPQTLIYRPSPMLLEVAHVVHRSSSLSDHIVDALRELCRATGHTGYVSMLDSRNVLVLRAVPGTHALRVVSHPGDRSPAWATSTGRALLARLDDDVLAREFGEHLECRGVNSPTSFKVLMSRLKEVRQHQWSVAVDEAISGAASVSCAVGDPQSGETMAFCLTFPASMASKENSVRLADLLLARARQIGRMLGDSYWATNGT